MPKKSLNLRSWQTYLLQRHSCRAHGHWLITHWKVRKESLIVVSRVQEIQAHPTAVPHLTIAFQTRRPSTLASTIWTRKSCPYKSISIRWWLPSAYSCEPWLIWWNRILTHKRQPWLLTKSLNYAYKEGDHLFKNCTKFRSRLWTMPFRISS